MLRRWGALVVFALAVGATGVGCGGGDDVHADADAGLPPGITRSPDAMGYCCRMRAASMCGAAVELGGFTRGAPYPCRVASDVAPSAATPIATDEHGCMYWDISLPRDACVRFDAGS